MYSFIQYQKLMEGVSAHGNELLAYVMVVAEEYHKLPKVTKSDLKHWESLATSVEKFMPRMMSDVKVVFTTEDPYPNQREMMYDIIVNKRMKIYATTDDGGQEGQHPGLSNKQNNILRAVHDYATHYAKNAKWFKKFLKTGHIKDVKQKEFKMVRFSHHAFTVRGEMNTFVTHSRIAPKLAVPALFTEIVGQICTYFVTGKFTDNKASVMDGIDFKNVGKFTSSGLQKRKEKYLAMLNDDSIKTIKLNFGGVVIDKSKIRWGLLSRGEGQKRK